MVKYVLTALVAFAFASVAQSQSQQPIEMKKTKEGQATGERTMTVKAKVKAVDLANRTITVEEKGGTETFKVDEQVKRLNEIAPGDTIVVKFHQGLMLQSKPPPEGSEQPAAAVASGRAGQDSPPAAGATGAVQGMVTVTAVDPKSRIVVLQTPGGELFKVKAGPDIKLDRVKTGDKLYGVYTETLAIGVEKANKGSPPKTN